MTVNEAIRYLEEIDRKYQTEEDKNYYLVHGLSDVSNDLNDDDFEELKAEIWERFSKQGRQYLSFLDYLIVASKDNQVVKQHVNKTWIKHKKIYNIIDFYNDYDENLIRYIKGHLFLEYIIETIIEKSLHIVVDKKDSFYVKIKCLKDNKIINEKEYDLLIKIKEIRNDIAHVLDYNISFNKLFNIVKLSAECGVDYSDSTIYKNRKLSKEWYGVKGLIDELFPNLFCHLLYENENYFKDEEIYKYMI